MPPFGFPRRSEFITPPAEPSVTQLVAELRSRIDAALRLCDAFAAGADPDVRDAALEIRLALRPTDVPVVAGPDRFEERLKNYEENPR